MRCPNCSNENPDKIKFCIECGANLENIKTEETNNETVSREIENSNSFPQSNPINNNNNTSGQSQPIQNPTNSSVSSSTGTMTLASVIIRDGKKYTLGKNSFLSAIFSFFITGLGQFYNGDYLKGVALLIVFFIGVGLTGGILSFFVWLYGIFDAYQVAKGKYPLWM